MQHQDYVQNCVISSLTRDVIAYNRNFSDVSHEIVISDKISRSYLVIKADASLRLKHLRVSIKLT